MEKGVIQQDFDRIAQLNESKWDHNLHYHKYLKMHIPDKVHTSLDIGCGTGAFSRLLANKSKQVVGIDLSPEMINKAKELSKGYKNIDYRVEDVMEYNFEVNNYDCIVSIATMHHLPMVEVLKKLKTALKPGGSLLILDLYEQKTITDILMSLVAVPINLLYMLFKSGKLRKSRDEIEAWDEHCKHDKYMTLEELRTICNKMLPGYILKRHLFWRYSLVWNKKV